ncbi:MAG: helix-turn-helix transcriptional regulator [Spirochaetaceae bacterium]|jgi:DNA-binding CsgD family transcriptional regulator|nr:helix-turn-helix transcriptional regulator [Spirochaetaceae bacterium]
MFNLFAELIMAAIRFASLYVVFYLLIPPSTKFLRICFFIVAALAMPLTRFTYWLLSSAAFSTYLANDAAHILPPFLLALICSIKNKEQSGFSRAWIGALYFPSIWILVEAIASCFYFTIANSMPIQGSFSNYLVVTLMECTCFGWSVFYYRTAREMPISSKAYSFKPFWVIVLTTPVLLMLTMTPLLVPLTPYLGKTDAEYTTRNFAVIGYLLSFILALDIGIFYLYVKLAVHYEARVIADEVASFPEAAPPPVWTPEKGLTERFIVKFRLTPREREVADLAIQGKSNKEIATSLGIKLNTTDVHLRHIYEKTGTQGRFALMSLCTYDALRRK